MREQGCGDECFMTADVIAIRFILALAAHSQRGFFFKKFFILLFQFFSN